MPNIHAFATQSDLSAAAADLFVQLATASQKPLFFVALSGGSTPQALFKLLATPPYANALPWEQIHFFWGDERLVSPDDPGSNYGQAKALLFDHVPIPAANIHRVKGELPSGLAIVDYVDQLNQAVDDCGRAWPHFDLCLMGMGADGHTASLFPGPISTVEKTQPVMTVTAVYEDRPANRLTLTPLVFNDARYVLFLVTGEKKAEAVTAVLHGPPDPEKWPAQRIQPHHGQMDWFLDQAA
ncbi:MAG: 6-phosphogluconolactonase, partial [Anaerolineales bacterium]|nr:6-phosphogluconolactonase [Anaerolineales bacterium]